MIDHVGDVVDLVIAMFRRRSVRRSREAEPLSVGAATLADLDRRRDAGEIGSLDNERKRREIVDGLLK